LQNAQQAGGPERPTIAQQGVVLLLDANTGDAPQDVQAVGQLLELHELHLPGTILLLDDGFQGKCGVAMAAAGVVKNNVNFPGLRVHLANIARFMRTLLHRLLAFRKSIQHAMWITR
jgi:hypothetical protein